jgi:hypothetical protein
VRADAALTELSGMLVSSNAPALVIDETGQPLGMIDKDTLLRNVQAGPRHG